MNVARKHNYNYDHHQEQPVRQICNVDSEGVIIGTLLRENDAYQLVSGIVQPEYFYEKCLGEIYGVIGDLIKQGKQAIPITIKPFVDWDKQLGELRDEDGRPFTVGKMVSRCVARLSMPVHDMIQQAELVRDLYKFRKLRQIGSDLIEECDSFDAATVPSDIGDRYISEISHTLSDGDDVYGAVSFGMALDEALEDTNRAYSGKKGTGISYRFRPVEELIGPMCGGQLIRHVENRTGKGISPAWGNSR